MKTPRIEIPHPLTLWAKKKTIILKNVGEGVSMEEIEAELQYYALRGEKADIDVYSDEDGNNWKVTILE